MTKEQREKFNQYHRYVIEANRMRGELLNNCINLERIIDEVLAYYFCETNITKRNDLLGIVFNSGKVGLKGKLDILNVISKKLYTDMQEDFKKIIPDIINRIIPARNAIAHRALEEVDLKVSYEQKNTVYKDAYSDKSFELSNWDFGRILIATSDYTGFFIGLVNRMDFEHTQYTQS